MLKKIISILTFLLVSNCTTFSDPKEKLPPTITHSMEINSAIIAAIQYGGQTLLQVKNLIKKRKLHQPAANILQQVLLSKNTSWNKKQIQRTFQLYQYSRPSTKQTSTLFAHLLTKDNVELHKTAWILATNFPSSVIAEKIEDYLTKAILDNDLASLLLPEMATAIANNQMTKSYTIIHQGLVKTHNLSFARALSTLNPTRASMDFLDYLALAPVEEIRQLNLASVNMLVCYEALNHLLHHEVSLGHPNFRHIFYFAISRNHGLAEIAKTIIERYTPEHPNHLAFILSSIPSWAQLAYIDRLKRNYKPINNLLLSELKNISVQYDVIEEIKSIIR